MKQLRPHQTEALNRMNNAARLTVNFPTGSGKSLIQSRDIVNRISGPGKPVVYVILSPRILLSNQLMGDTRTDLIENGVDCHYMVVHSGRGGVGNDSITEMERIQMLECNIHDRDIQTSTGTRIIREEFNKAQREGVPFIISSTYNSAERLIQADIPIEVLYCDEAHYLTRESWQYVTTDSFPAANKFFFTATRRVTMATTGFGMNNEASFGECIQKLPLDLVKSGDMLGTRLHVVDTVDQPEADEYDVCAVVEAFRQHSTYVNVGAKMLVVAKDGSDHLRMLATHPLMAQLKKDFPNLTIFDISTMYKANIDGRTVSRVEFLNELRSMDDDQPAIIIHRQILTEGIDVPGITGVMPLCNLGKDVFMQTLGRATRLNAHDRIKLYNGTMDPSDLDKFIKPEAWVILPSYGLMGDDLRTDLADIIYQLRSFGFNPDMNIHVGPNRGASEDEPDETVNEQEEDITDNIVTVITEILHDIEDREEVEMSKARERHISSMEYNELDTLFDDLFA